MTLRVPPELDDNTWRLEGIDSGVITECSDVSKLLQYLLTELNSLTNGEALTFEFTLLRR